MTYNYDIRYGGNLVIIEGTDGTKFSYWQDSQGNPQSVIYQINSSLRTLSYQYDNEGNSSTITLPNNTSMNKTFDEKKRISSCVLSTGNSAQISTTYNYSSNNNLLSVNNSSDGTWLYTYDGKGNIISVSQNGVQKIRYAYDNLGQIIREDNAYSSQSYIYAYDVGGNITSKSVYAYTTGELGAATDTIVYTYGDTGWKDLLTAYNGNTITYDAIGNPLSYNGWTYTWQRGRQLASASKTGTNISYVYNDEGIRTSKTVNNVTTHYFLDNSNKVIGEQNVTDTIWYYYDANNKLIGFELNGTPYYYTRNVQGDITAIENTAGAVAARYTYDAWGNILSMTDGSGTDISSNTTAVGYINPYRYRGYRYDNETGMYYLQSRYYNPEIGRFINADDINYLGVGTLLSYNLICYCFNNPINCFDPTGHWVAYIGISISAVLFWGISAMIGILVDGKGNFGVMASWNYKVVGIALSKGVFMSFFWSYSTIHQYYDKKLCSVSIGLADLFGEYGNYLNTNPGLQINIGTGLCFTISGVGRSKLWVINIKSKLKSLYKVLTQNKSLIRKISIRRIRVKRRR